MPKKKQTKKPTTKATKCCDWGSKCSSNGGCIWFLGFVGTTAYYISTATGFWNGVWGVIKALVWPAILAFELFKFLGI